MARGRGGGGWAAPQRERGLHAETFVWNLHENLTPCSSFGPLELPLCIYFHSYIYIYLINLNKFLYLNPMNILFNYKFFEFEI